MKYTKDIDIRALQIFKTVAENGSLTKASKMLGITSSAISQTLSDMETHLNATLINRTKRPATLTPAGNVLYAESVKILQQIDKAISRTRHFGENPMQKITIEMAESLLSLISPHILHSMQNQIKNWRFSGTNTPNTAEKLHHSTIDMAIADTTTFPDTSPYITHTIIQEPYVLAVPKVYYNENAHSPVDVKSLLQSPLTFVRYGLHTITGRRIENYIRSLKHNISTQIEFDSAPAQLKMVQSGIGWGITTPLCYLQSTATTDDVILLPIMNTPLRRSLCVISQPYVGEDVTEQIATIARNITSSAISDLYLQYPWLKPHIIV